MSFLADRIGRRRTLIFFALTDFVAGSLLFLSTAWWAPVLAGIVGNMTVGSGEVGPFLSLEQAMLPRTCSSSRRTFAFSIYNLVGYGASSLGALIAGVPQYLGPSLTGYRALFLAYMASGLLGAFLYSTMSNKVELGQVREGKKHSALSPKARPIVFKLSALFSIDAIRRRLHRTKHSIILLLHPLRSRPINTRRNILCNTNCNCIVFSSGRTNCKENRLVTNNGV